jgi:hypothetical protein
MENTRMTRRTLRAASLAIGLCGVAVSYVPAPSASAAVVMAMDLPALVEQSELVVVANATKQSSRYVDKLIVTDVELKVISTLKGSRKPGETVSVTHLGGAVGDIGLNVPGAARFRLGETSVVFLRRAPSGEWNVTGMSQGILPITGQGTDQQVMPGGSGAQLMERDAEGRLVEQQHAPQAPRGLADLLREIERLVRAH